LGLLYHHCRFFFLFGILLSFIISFSSAYASISLNISAEDGQQGTQTNVSLSIETDVPVAGFNAEIIFPAGITVTNVLQGDLLLASGLFSIEYNLDGQSLRLSEYSTSDTVDSAGELAKITINLDESMLGLYELSFASVNPNPLINSTHAVSNEGGTVSQPHSTTTTTILVYSDTSDYDNDGLPDYWEVKYELNPRVDNEDTDSDEDGYTDLEEYAAGSNPSDPNSTPGPEVLFKDGFEEIK